MFLIISMVIIGKIKNEGVPTGSRCVALSFSLCVKLNSMIAIHILNLTGRIIDGCAFMLNWRGFILLRFAMTIAQNIRIHILFEYPEERLLISFLKALEKIFFRVPNFFDFIVVIIMVITNSQALLIMYEEGSNIENMFVIILFLLL